MPAPTAPDAFHRRTREQPPDPALLEECSQALREQATRLDVTYRLQMEAVSRARQEEAALLRTVLEAVRPALSALARPLLLLDVTAPGRPERLQLRGFPVFGELPRPRAAGSPREVLLLLENATFLRVHFSGPVLPSEAGRLPFAVRGLEGVDLRHVLRDHAVDEVMAVLLQAISSETAYRRSQARDTEAHVARLQALRLLLAG